MGTGPHGAETLKWFHRFKWNRWLQYKAANRKRAEHKVIKDYWRAATKSCQRAVRVESKKLMRAYRRAKK